MPNQVVMFAACVTSIVAAGTLKALGAAVPIDGWGDIRFGMSNADYNNLKVPRQFVMAGVVFEVTVGFDDDAEPDLMIKDEATYDRFESEHSKLDRILLSANSGPPFGRPTISPCPAPKIVAAISQKYGTPDKADPAAT
jgi:hypothetical protein